jgi:hypothetical protein
VDLRETQGDLTPPDDEKKPRNNRNNRVQKTKRPGDENVMKWCGIQAILDAHEMTFQTFLILMWMLAQGHKKLKFCNCPACNKAYRDMTALIVNTTEKKNLNANSREIVIKCRGEKIDGYTIDFSKLFHQEKAEGTFCQEQPAVLSHKINRGRIVIELEPEVLEETVINVLQSERGREIISSIPRRRGRKKMIKPSH